MRVAVVTNMYPVDGSPSFGVFVHELVTELRDLDVDVDVLFTNPKHGRADYLFDVVPFARRLKSFDLLHAQHTYCVAQLRAAEALARHSPPLVLTVHEGEALRNGTRDPHASIFKRTFGGPAYKRWAMNHADCVVAVERRLPPAAGYRGSFEVLPYGVDVEKFLPMDKLSCRAELGFRADRPLILFPGDRARSFEKGVDLFEQSLRWVSASLCVVMGGDIPHDRMPVYMNAADVVVITSRYEASPMVVKEAMACGRPMVSTDVGDVREIFGDTPGYFLARPEPEEIGRGIDAALSWGDRTSGPERISRLGLSATQVAGRYAALYRRVLARASA